MFLPGLPFILFFVSNEYFKKRKWPHRCLVAGTIFLIIAMIGFIVSPNARNAVRDANERLATFIFCVISIIMGILKIIRVKNFLKNKSL